MDTATNAASMLTVTTLRRTVPGSPVSSYRNAKSNGMVRLMDADGVSPRPLNGAVLIRGLLERRRRGLCSPGTRRTAFRVPSVLRRGHGSSNVADTAAAAAAF